MKSAAAPGPAWSAPSAPADSRARTVVVPTATTRPPAVRAAADVGWQRHLPHPLEPGERGLVERQAEPPAAVTERRHPLPLVAREVDPLAGARRAAHEHFPLALFTERRDEEDLEPPAARPP